MLPGRVILDPELTKGLPDDPDRLELVKGMHARKTALLM